MFSALLRVIVRKGFISREEVLLDAIFCPDNEKISTGNATGGRLGISPFENPLSENYDE